MKVYFSSARRCLVLFFSDGFILHRAEWRRKSRKTQQVSRLSLGRDSVLEFYIGENRRENNERFKNHMKTTFRNLQVFCEDEIVVIQLWRSFSDWMKQKKASKDWFCLCHFNVKALKRVALITHIGTAYYLRKIQMHILLLCIRLQHNPAEERRKASMNVFITFQYLHSMR